MTISGPRLFLVIQPLLFSASIPVETASAADLVTLPPSCIKPHRPLQFTSEWEVDQFMSKVEAYKSCIAQFVEEQREAAREHQAAAQRAVDEWNNFVSSAPGRGPHTATKPDRDQLKVGAGSHGQR